jgi:hypothetical protein
MKEERSHERFRPERYGMRYCPSCHGAGKAPDSEDRTPVCILCGGFGWIRNENGLQLRNPDLAAGHTAP